MDEKGRFQKGDGLIDITGQKFGRLTAIKPVGYTNGYNENLTLDRIDNEGDYTPENCRWVTMKVQESNKRNNHFVVLNGEKITMSECARRLGLTVNQFRYRHIVKGMTIDEISQDCGIMCYLALDELKENKDD